MRNHSPRVSVIIPVFDRNALLAEAVKSVLLQTLQDFEIIIIDDGSPTFVEIPVSDERISVIRNERNSGPAAARNAGIAVARGEIVAFLDSDDVWHPEKLFKQVTCMDVQPQAGLVHSFYSKFEGATGRELGTRDTSWFSGWIYPEILLQWAVLMATDTVLIPRHVLLDVGGFNEDLHNGEDLELWSRISRRYPLLVIPEVLTHVRVHSTSLSFSKKNASAQFHLYLEKVFSDDPGLSSNIRRRALARMYSYSGYNQLGEISPDQIYTVRQDCVNALYNWPLEWNAYICLILSFLSPSLRKWLVNYWRNRRYHLGH